MSFPRGGRDLQSANRPRRTYPPMKTRIICEMYFRDPLRKSDICNGGRNLPPRCYQSIYSLRICCSNLWYGGFCRTIWGSSYNCALPPQIGRLVNLTYLWVILFSTNELYCHIIEASRNVWHGEVYRPDCKFLSSSNCNSFTELISLSLQKLQ